jgi:hypothetical protein
MKEITDQMGIMNLINGTNLLKHYLIGPYKVNLAEILSITIDTENTKINIKTKNQGNFQFKRFDDITVGIKDMLASERVNGPVMKKAIDPILSMELEKILSA